MAARRGSATVELSFLLPVVLAMVLGLCDVAWIFFQHGVLVRALRTGCRAGAVVAANGDPEVSATAAITGLLDDWHYACPAEGACAPDVALVMDAEGRDVLTCRLSVPVGGLSGLVLSSNELRLTSATRVHVESWEHP
jgi:hypothetical protein